MKKSLFAILLIVLVVTANLTSLAQKDSKNNPKLSNNVSTEFFAAEAFSDGNGAWLKWQMVSEEQNLGFNVYRINGDRKDPANNFIIGGGFIQSTDEIVNGRSYTFFDPKGTSNSIYTIESVGIDGRKIFSDFVFTRFVENLTAVAGSSSADFVKNLKNSNPILQSNKLILPAEIENELNGNFLPPDLIKQRQVAGQSGVKISTKKEGIYRVSRSELQTAGFDVNAASSNWQLFKDGNEQAIIVGSNGDYIEFYGKGINTNEADQQIYFLINGNQNGKRVLPGYQRGFAGNVIGQSYDQSFERADRIIYLNTLRNGDDNNYFSDKIVNTTGAIITFNLNGINFNAPKISLDVKAQGFTATPHNIEATLNGEQLGFFTGTNYELMNGHFEIPTSSLIEGTNTLLLKVPSNAADISFFDSIKINYSRLYKAQQNTLSFYTNPYKKTIVSGFTSQNIRVFDITQPDAPLLISNLVTSENNGNFSVILPANRSKLLYAVENSNILSADSITLNTPSTLATSNHSADLIIISYKDWLTEAETWANYRRNDGFLVEVVQIEDIFDEYNYGIVSANSIRDFLLDSQTNWTTEPRYVLILGDTTYDPRNYQGAGNFNYVPTQMIDTVYEETGSDEALADFNDDGLAELAIGRVPARNSGDVIQNLNKVTIFEQTSPQGFSRGALFVSDLPNGYDFQAMNQRLATELPPTTPIMAVNRGDSNARSNLLASLNSGKYLVNYSGHGSTGIWAVSQFYGPNDPQNMTNGNNYSIFTMLTCLNGYFLLINQDSLSESILKAPNGGGVAVWSSTGKTTPDVQEILARRFYQQISFGNMNRMGDLVKDAKQALFGGRDVRLSWGLLGDPTLKVK